MKTRKIISIVSMAAIFAGVVNMVIFREYWILGVVVAVLVPLTIYSVKLKRQGK